MGSKMDQSTTHYQHLALCNMTFMNDSLSGFAMNLPWPLICISYMCAIVYCLLDETGTTWTLQIIQCLMAKGEPETLTGTLDDLFPWVETVPDLSDVISKPSPRVLKSHG